MNDSKTLSNVYIYLSILCVWMFCLHVCMCITCMVPDTRPQRPEERKHQISWEQTFRWLWLTMWGLEIKCPLQEHQVSLTASTLSSPKTS